MTSVRTFMILIMHFFNSPELCIERIMLASHSSAIATYRAIETDMILISLLVFMIYEFTLYIAVTYFDEIPHCAY